MNIVDAFDRSVGPLSDKKKKNIEVRSKGNW